jgi:octaprenyl-diphosphate synthase
MARVSITIRAMEITQAQQLIQTDLKAVDKVIHEHLHSAVPLAEEIAEYIISAGGKRIRPTLVLLSAKAFGYEGQSHVHLAAIIEMLHTATLLHDDVIDSSQMRRGRKTANAVWGNQASVLVGDLLHARSFQLIAGMDHPMITDILACATSVIVEGELLQLTHCHDPRTSEQTYLEIIQHKTGKLFEVATHVGPILADRTPEECEAMACYGRNLGAAFQIIDDALDYDGDAAITGKNIGDDLAEGKPTLPLIYVLHHGSESERTVIKAALQKPELANIDAIQQIIADNKAIDYAKQCAERFVQGAKQSLEIIPESQYRVILNDLANIAIRRNK